MQFCSNRTSAGYMYMSKPDDKCIWLASLQPDGNDAFNGHVILGYIGDRT